jgi:hypothetical protein
MARKESFPVAFEDALRAARERGELVLTFASREVCTRERLRFYRFLAQVRSTPEHELHAVALTCVVQWKELRGVKRVLRVVADGRASDDVWAQAARDDAPSGEAARALEVEDALAAIRAELGK